MERPDWKTIACSRGTPKFKVKEFKEDEREYFRLLESYCDYLEGVIEGAKEGVKETPSFEVVGFESTREHYEKTEKKIKNEKALDSYFSRYDAEPDLNKKLTLTYDFVDDLFVNSDKPFFNPSKTMETIRDLMIHYDSIDFHLSELKTMLVITKHFWNNVTIRDSRRKLKETYEKKKTNLK